MLRSQSTGHFKPKKNTAASIAAALAAPTTFVPKQKRALEQATDEVYADGTIGSEINSVNNTPELEDAETSNAKRSRSQPSQPTQTNSSDSLSELGEAFSKLRM